MPLTDGHAAYGALHESAFNKLFDAFAVARPENFRFATPALAGPPGSSTVMPLLPIPGANYGLNYALAVKVPRFDFFPQTLPLPSPLQLQPGDFSVTMGVHITIDCLAVRQNEGHGTLLAADLDIAGVGRPTSTKASATDTWVGLEIIDLVLTGAGNLGELAGCYGRDILNALQGKARYLASKQVLGAFAFKLGAGPEIWDSQLKVWSDII